MRWNNVTCLCSLPKDRTFIAYWDNHECMAYYDEELGSFLVVDVIEVDKEKESRLTYWQEMPELEEFSNEYQDIVNNFLVNSKITSSP